MTSSKFPRIAIGDGKYCYSGPNCKRHGKNSNAAVIASGIPQLNRQDMLVQAIDIHYAESAQRIKDLICSKGEIMKSLSELDGMEINNAFRLHKCVKHGGYHAYDSEVIRKPLAGVGGAAHSWLNNEIKEGMVSKEESQELRTIIANTQKEFFDSFIEGDKEPIKKGKQDLLDDAQPLLVSVEDLSDAHAARYWKCGRKNKHSTEERASRQIKSDDMTTYKCQYCDGWHVGHGEGGEPVEESIANGRKHWSEHHARANGYVRRYILTKE